MRSIRKTMSKSGSIAGKHLGVLALGVAMTCAGAAMGQKKPTPAPAKPAATPQKPATPVKPGQNNPVKPGPNNPVKPGPNNPVKPATNNPVKPVNVHTDPKELPEGKKVPTRNGGSVVKTGNTVTQYNEKGRPTAIKKPGLDAKFGSSGRPTMVRAVDPVKGVQVVHHGPGDIRRAEGFHAAGPGGGQVHTVAIGPRNGYVERPVFGRPGFVRRSSIYGDRRYAVVYRNYHYRNFAYYRPVPVVIYSPGYYVWASQPWGPAVTIQLGFAQQPWYTAYGTTFVPYQQYASADQWMTDQILAQGMQQAYEAGKAAGTQAASADVPLAPPPVPPSVKEQLDAQVKQEVMEQGQQAQGGVAAVDPPPATANEPDEIPEALKPGHTVFRVVATLDVQSDGDDCELNTDDWIIRNGDMDAQGTVPVTVAASRASDCPTGSTTRISLNDLTTMQNEQDEQIGNALKLASLTMGKNGMPAGPAPGAVPVPGGQAQPDLDLADNLKKEQVEANAAEAQAVAPPAPAGQ